MAKKYICKNSKCKCEYEYCRGCLISPIPYKEAGFCSMVCYEASKNVDDPVVECEITEDVVVVEEQKQTEEVIEEASVEVEAGASSVDITVEIKPEVKKETDVYKKKKNKYQVHE